MTRLDLLLGQGVFETILVHAGQPVLLEEHLARLSSAAAALGLSAPRTATLAARLRRHARRLPAGHGRLRVALLRPRSGAGGVVVEAAALPPRVSPVRLATAPSGFSPPPELARYKVTNRMPYLAAQAWAQGQGAHEALLTTPHGEVTEATQANLFAVFGGALVTPPCSLPLLAGITRAAVLGLAPELGLECREEALTPRRLQEAQELFLTSALAGVNPVVGLDGRLFPAPGPVTLALAAAYARRWLGGEEGARHSQHGRDGV